MNTITLQLSDNQVNMLLDSIELMKSKLIKERNKPRELNEIDAEYLTGLTLNIHEMQSIRKQII